MHVNINPLKQGEGQREKKVEGRSKKHFIYVKVYINCSSFDAPRECPLVLLVQARWRERNCWEVNKVEC
jgi:hypothetical protein